MSVCVYSRSLTTLGCGNTTEVGSDYCPTHFPFAVCCVVAGCATDLQSTFPLCPAHLALYTAAGLPALLSWLPSLAEKSSQTRVDLAL